VKRYIKLNTYGYDSELDTGWGNRFEIWKYGYVLNKINNFDFQLVIESEYWPELDYIDIPYLKTDYINDINSKVLPKNLDILDKTKNWYMDDSIFYCIAGESPYKIPTLKLKDKKLDTSIRKKLKNSVGIHIRLKNWKSTENVELGFMQDYERNPKPLYDYCDSLIKKVDNFYISTDIIREDLPNLKESNNKFLKEFYNRYETIDYSDIYKVNNKPLRDVIDLFSLIYCDTFIVGQSSWSGFVENYRREINNNRNHRIEMEYINAHDIR